jgi:ATP-dependent DNA helicase RecQ
MWPGGSFGSRGRIAAEQMAAPGRTLVFADAPEWRELVASVFARDAPAPTELLEACVRLLSAWRAEWPARPEIVIDLPAAGMTALTSSVADHLAAVGRLDRGSLTCPALPPHLGDMSSAQEATWWRDHLDGSQLAGAVQGRPVLLVVDATSSLWPVTVGAALLRRSGSSLVLPLLLHRRP